jgi:hypothetical protein
MAMLWEDRGIEGTGRREMLARRDIVEVEIEKAAGGERGKDLRGEVLVV